MVDDQRSSRKKPRHYEKNHIPPCGRTARGPRPRGVWRTRTRSRGRHADNSVVYVSFYQDDRQVGVAMEQGAVQTILPNEALAAAEGEEEDGAEAPAGPPRYSGEGYTLVGASDASTVQFAAPGRGMQSCNS